MTQKYFGVMTVNVTGVELLIVNLKTHKSLEKVTKEINLGDDVYRQHPVRFESVNKIVEALTGLFRSYMIMGWKIINYGEVRPCHRLLMLTLWRINFSYTLVLKFVGYQ